MPYKDAVADDSEVVDLPLFVMPFGKHAGKMLQEIWDEYPGYLTWLAEKGTSPDVVAKVREFIKHHGGTFIASSLVMPFGKHSGKTIEDIYQEDPKYVEWLADNVSDADIRERACVFLGR